MIFCEYAGPIPGNASKSALDALFRSTNLDALAGAGLDLLVAFWGDAALALGTAVSPDARTRARTKANKRQRFFFIMFPQNFEIFDVARYGFGTAQNIKESLRRSNIPGEQ
jgi:hypothetical protein